MHRFNSFFDELITHPLLRASLRLPLFHTMDVATLSHILTSKQLRPQPCPVFKENLLYLSYGKPGYKVDQPFTSRQTALMPVVIILKPQAIHSIIRAYPFDSGGFKLYKEQMHRKMRLEDFMITPHLPAIEKVVQFFFDNNMGYYQGSAIQQIKYDLIQTPIEAYHALITNKCLSQADDRKMSVEIQVNYPLLLTKETVEAIILPEMLATNSIIKTFVSDTAAAVISIPNYGLPFNMYYVFYLEEIKKFLQKKQYFNDN
ncbi:hypothetical protein [Chitinophaga sp. LS1]|uniref:hypothetical protein n=1 Tax=Chitinophaga sp. LS1 TaxID=3051176 RepID=UPI002AAAD6CF|nr:hypothetical protein [Chitinophaga sp. LS1]WPV67828.1 hypothetical protein QQL36_03710 [Chitinophaga sp. LS1]